MYKSAIFCFLCGLLTLGVSVLQDSKLLLIGGIFTSFTGVFLQLRLEFDQKIADLKKVIEEK